MNHSETIVRASKNFLYFLGAVTFFIFVSIIKSPQSISYLENDKLPYIAALIYGLIFTSISGFNIRLKENYLEIGFFHWIRKRINLQDVCIIKIHNVRNRRKKRTEYLALEDINHRENRINLTFYKDRDICSLLETIKQRNPKIHFGSDANTRNYFDRVREQGNSKVQEKIWFALTAIFIFFSILILLKK